MSGRSATKLLEIRHDLTALDEPGFWAIMGTFEGEWTLARFGEITETEFVASEIEVRVGQWRSSKSQSEYIDYVQQIKNLISLGEVYQVNACRTLSSELLSSGDFSPLFTKILKENPAPYAGYLSLPDLEIASASPERFLSKTGNQLLSSPIKGTSATTDFLDKDRAENLMIVDLIRNDIGSIARIGSVSTPRLLDTEPHPGLFHLVSDIAAELREDLSISIALSAIMPPGSVSGAPKSSAIKVIEANEGSRGPYCGVLGWSDGERMELAVAIRTFWKEGNEIRFGTGAGITWDSDPVMEWEETELKARRLISLLR